MILKPTFTNGKCRHGGVNTVSSQIPHTALNRIRRTKSSAETIAALLNETERLHSWRRKNALAWSECRTCKVMFLHYRKSTGHYCSKPCCGKAKDWLRQHSANGKGKKRPGKGLAGAKNPAWKGGLTYFKRKGKYADQSIKYVRCPVPFMDMARKDGYVMEHRLIVAMTLGRSLLRSECVHHINHDATDNRIENLMLFATNADHKRHEHGQPIEPLWRPSRRLNTPA
jgi:hypothetical protein